MMTIEPKANLQRLKMTAVMALTIKNKKICINAKNELIHPMWQVYLVQTKVSKANKNK